MVILETGTTTVERTNVFKTRERFAIHTLGALRTRNGIGKKNVSLSRSWPPFISYGSDCTCCKALLVSCCTTRSHHSNYFSIRDAIFLYKLLLQVEYDICFRLYMKYAAATTTVCLNAVHTSIELREPRRSLLFFFFSFVCFLESHCTFSIVDVMSSCVKRDMHFEQQCLRDVRYIPVFASCFREMEKS